MGLHATRIGTGAPQLVFLHGLFGQGKNWTSIARALEPLCPSLLVDLPNHGHSPWTEGFSYPALAEALADDLAARLEPGARVVLVGHSMGGKAAMTLALRHARLLKGLVVVDVSPDRFAHDEFAHIVSALRALPVGTLRRRNDAFEALEPAIPEPPIRSFLLQNLRRRTDADGFAWGFNLELLGRALPLISGWPADVSGRYEGPVLWIRGALSGYVRPEHLPEMSRLFPSVTLRTVEGAGHWVHSQKPVEVAALLRAFLLQEGLVSEPA